MKIIFVDAENVGFKGLEAIKANIIDKVFVFSRVGSIQAYAEQNLFLCLSDYPDGANQADFYIIAYLARVLASTSKAEKAHIEFVLYSNDLNLINTFKFQCGMLDAKNNIVSINHDVPPAVTKSVVCNIKKSPKSDQVENQIFNMLKNPQGLVEIQESLNLPRPVFTKAVNELVNSQRITRSSKNRKNWIQAKHA